MSYLSKLKDIKAFVFDVDGVLTDGTILLNSDGSMCRTMNVLDGYAIVKALKKGYIIGIITGGDDAGVRNRINYLGIKDYYAKSSNKVKDYEDFKAKYQLNDENVLMMGDDIPDLELIKLCGIGACPPNAVPEIKAVADYISPVYGGKGAVRDVIEMVLKSKNQWNNDDETQST